MGARTADDGAPEDEWSCELECADEEADEDSEWGDAVVVGLLVLLEVVGAALLVDDVEGCVEECDDDEVATQSRLGLAPPARAKGGERTHQWW